MKPHQWNGQEQQFEGRAPQHNEMAQMVHTEQEKWIDPHQTIAAVSMDSADAVNGPEPADTATTSE